MSDYSERLVSCLSTIEKHVVPELGVVAATASHAGTYAPIEAADRERHVAADSHVRACPDVPDWRTPRPKLEEAPSKGDRLQPHAAEAEIVLEADLPLRF